MSFAERLTAAWYTPGLTPLTAALAPLSPLFEGVVGIRRTLYRRNVLRVERLPVPVIVIGNITVGGTGKTPLTATLANALTERGWRPGIVSRGYGGDTEAAHEVSAASTPEQVGDEPVLLAKRTGLPVWVGRDRVAAARGLLSVQPTCDVIIADDGLQHYALARDVEIAVVDGDRGFGNGLALPAGPLRESRSRLREVDAVVRLVTRRTEAHAGEFAMILTGDRFVRVNAPATIVDAEAFRRPGVHAVAGIGNPQRFFVHLSALGIAATCHAFPDHHRFAPPDLALPGAGAILMTEKDAVKCTAFADDRCWALPVRAEVDPSLLALVEEKLRGFQAA